MARRRLVARFRWRVWLGHLGFVQERVKVVVRLGLALGLGASAGRVLLGECLPGLGSALGFVVFRVK